jgi:protease-4
LRINSPGGGVSATEQIFLELLRLRQQKPVVVSVGAIAASGGYYAALASNFIYAEPTSQIGSIGVWVNLPIREELEEKIGTSGPFKATGFSMRKAVSNMEIVRQTFVEAVVSQRGERLRLSGEELSRAELYLGLEGIRNGLIDDIGTRTAAIEKAANLAGVRNYGVIDLVIPGPVVFPFFSAADLEALKSQISFVPVYYYLYFEQE